MSADAQWYAMVDDLVDGIVESYRHNKPATTNEILVALTLGVRQWLKDNQEDDMLGQAMMMAHIAATAIQRLIHEGQHPTP
jgi:hypothetical protein